MKAENKLRNQLLAKYHILATKRGMTPELREAFLEGTFRVKSSSRLNIEQLKDAIKLLSPSEPEKQIADPSMWRKRVMAAIGGWLKNVNREQNSELIKGIACQATGYASFNAIPVSRLRDLYNEFLKKNKTTVAVQQIVSSEIEYLSTVN